MTASITVGGLIDEPSRCVDYFGITSKGLDERFHPAEPATARTSDFPENKPIEVGPRFPSVVDSLTKHPNALSV